MPFLRLNGMKIPVATGSADLDRQSIGSRGRSFNGTLLTDRRAIKRKWSLRTTPLDETEANAVIGILEGLGHVFHYDAGSDTYSEVDPYSSKGLAPTTVPGAGFLRFGKSEAGAEDVYDTGDETESLFRSTGCIEVAGAITNLAPQNVSDGSDTSANTSGWTALVGSTIATSVDQALQGSRSIKVTSSGASGEGIEVDAISISASTTYAITVHVYARTTGDLTLQVVGDVSGTITSDTTTLTSFRWYRWTLAATTGGSDSTLKIQILHSGAASSVIYYVDAVQLEAGGRATPWKHSDSARTSASPDYPATAFQSYRDFTINVWVKAAAIPSVGGFLVASAADGTNHILISHTIATGTLRFRILSIGVDIDIASTAFDDTWHMITCVYNSAADGSTYNKAQLFVDGASVGTDNTVSGVHDPSGLDSFGIGNISNASHFQGAMEDLTILPYAMTPTQVADLYTAGNTDAQTMSDLPKVLMDGDIVPDPDYGVTVQGVVTAVEYVQAGGSNAAWENNRRVISFDLEEV